MTKTKIDIEINNINRLRVSKAIKSSLIKMITSKIQIILNKKKRLIIQKILIDKIKTTEN